MYAFCYRSGQIHFGRKVPDGAIAMASGPARKVRDFFCGVSRHAYDGKTLLVPGIPEAEGDDEAESALRRFVDWITPQFKDRGLTPLRRA